MSLADPGNLGACVCPEAEQLRNTSEPWELTTQTIKGLTRLSIIARKRRTGEGAIFRNVLFSDLPT